MSRHSRTVGNFRESGGSNTAIGSGFRARVWRRSPVKLQRLLGRLEAHLLQKGSMIGVGFIGHGSRDDHLPSTHGLPTAALKFSLSDVQTLTT
jgi:hypothetical protein